MSGEIPTCKKPIRWRLRSKGLLAAVALLLISSSAHAEGTDRPDVQLFDGTTLIGWEQSSGAPQPWSLVPNALRGTEQSGKLAVEHSYGSATWKFSFTGAAGSALRIELQEAPGAAGTPPSLLSVRLAADAQCGAITSGNDVVAPGTAIADNAEHRHEAEIVHGPETLVVKVDGQETSKFAIPAGRRTGFALAVISGQVDVAPIRCRELGGQPFFNGTDLTGFYSDGKIESWAVEQGAIVNLAKGGAYLRTEKVYGNFTLDLDYRIAKGGNSGVGIRTPVGKWPSADGMEIQVLDEPDDKRISHESTAGVYRNMPAFRRADRHEPEWNHLVIKADGPMLSVWMNGLLVNHVNLSLHSTLRYRDKAGWIGFQDHGNRVEYKNISIVEAPAGDGFPHWMAPRAPAPGQRVLGPALDPAELLMVRQVREGVVRGDATSAATPNAPLVDLVGPGVITRIFRSNASGSLAFYFDNEPGPRITSSWSELAKKIPVVSASPTTVYTFLPYREKLRIVQTGAPPAHFQFAYTTYPPGTPLVSGPAPLPGDDRGWFFALDYARQHHNSGTLPFEPYLKPSTSGPQDLAPGATAVLADVAGSGQTRWLKFTPPTPALLADNALWLDVFVDGEAEPAISAPARLLFPNLVPENGATKSSSFILTQNGSGAFNLLPIPFTNGLKIVGRNAGDKPLTGVGVEAGVNPIPADRVPGVRLRGRYVPSATPNTSWLAASGAGKLVWISMDQPSPNLGTIASVAIDEQLQPAWTGTAVASWLGRDTPQVNHVSALDGSAGPITWRHLLIDPVCFEKSIKFDLAAPPAPVGGRLALFYLAK